MKKKLIILLLLAAAGFVFYKISVAPKREGLAARYREHEVTWKQVEQTRSVLSLLGEKGRLSDREIVDRILDGYILWDEAKALGVTVSESEVAEQLKQLPLPDGKSTLEDYLHTLGGSLDGYLDILRQQLLSRLTLTRLRELLARQYCEEHHLDLDPDRLPDEVSRAVGEKLDALLESRRAEIIYYF